MPTHTLRSLAAICLLCTAWALLAAAAPPAPPVPPDSRPAGWMTTQTQPAVRVKMADLFGLKVVHRKLVLEAVAEVTNNTGVAVDFAHLRGIYQYWNNPSYFRIFGGTATDLSKADYSLWVSFEAGIVVLHRTTQPADGAGPIRTVSLTQALNPAEPLLTVLKLPAGHARLTILEQMPGERAPAKRVLDLDADDFVALRMGHAAEVEAYVRPLLRDAGSEAVMYLGDAVAAPVVLPPEPDLPGRVAALVKQLDADEGDQRRQARQKLEELGPGVGPLLTALDRSKLSLEQTGAIDALLQSPPCVDAKLAATLRDDASFLTDCLYSENPAIRAAALERLKKVTGLKMDFDLALPLERRVEAVENLRGQLAK